MPLTGARGFRYGLEDLAAPTQSIAMPKPRGQFLLRAFLP